MIKIFMKMIIKKDGHDYVEDCDEGDSDGDGDWRGGDDCLTILMTNLRDPGGDLDNDESDNMMI